MHAWNKKSTTTYTKKKPKLLVFLVFCNGPEEVGIVLAIITGYGALSTIANNYGTEVFRNTSNGLNSVRTCRTWKCDKSLLVRQCIVIVLSPSMPTVERNLDVSFVLMMSINFFMTTSASHFPLLILRTRLWLERMLEFWLTSSMAIWATDGRDYKFGLFLFVVTFCQFRSSVLLASYWEYSSDIQFMLAL